MTLTNLYGCNTYYPSNLMENFAYSSAYSFALVAEGAKVAWIMQVPKTGTLKKVMFRTNVITTGGDLTFTIETVDAATSLPTGTLYIANASGSVTIADANDNVVLTCSINSTTGVTITEGHWIAIVATAPAGFSGIIHEGLAMYANSPYSLDYTPTTWTRRLYSPSIALVYSDEILCSRGCYVPNVLTNIAWSSSSNPDRRGLRFKLPFKARLVGVGIGCSRQNDWDILVYGSDGSTLLLTESIDKDYCYLLTSDYISSIKFTTPITIEKDTYYRIVILPKSTTSQTLGRNIYLLPDIDGLPVMNGLAGGVYFHYTTCNGAPANEAAWTNDLTIRPTIRLNIDQIDVGGGGLLRNPGTDGGCNA